MDLSGFDFLLLGYLAGSMFGNFTTNFLLLLFLLITNRKIAGIETWTYITYGYNFFNRLILSYGFTPIKNESHPLNEISDTQNSDQTIKPAQIESYNLALIKTEPTLDKVKAVDNISTEKKAKTRKKKDRANNMSQSQPAPKSIPSIELAQKLELQNQIN